MTKCEAAAAAGLTLEPDAAADPEGGRKHETCHRARIALMPMCAASDPSAAMRTNASHTASGRRQKNGRDPARVRGEPPGGKKRRRDDKAQ